ncbi:DUF2628 domain-containing protein [bacterium]|nr:DUF2628 domain-containing protein [bacterium]
MFGRLNLYSVYRPTRSNKPLEEMQYVPQGFNWAALIFPILWSLYHRLWFITALLVLVETGTWWAMQHKLADPSLIMALKLCWDVYIGISANDWREAYLQSRGYTLADVVTGKGHMEAERRFLDRWFHDQSVYHPNQGVLV